MENFDFFKQLGNESRPWRYVDDNIEGIREDIMRPYSLKLEISALSLDDAYKIYDVISPILQEYKGRISYKFPYRKEQFLENLNNIEKGNLFVIYTRTDEEAISLSRKLDEALMTIKNEITPYTGLSSLEIGNSGNLAIVMDRDIKGKYLSRTSSCYDVGRDVHPEIFERLQNILEENNLLTSSSRTNNEEKLKILFDKEKSILTQDILKELETKSKEQKISIAYIFENYKVPKELFNDALLLGVKSNIFGIAADFSYLDYKGYTKQDYLDFCKNNEDALYILPEIIEYTKEPITINDLRYIFQGKEEEFCFELSECIEKSLERLPIQDREFLENTSLESFGDYYFDSKSANIILKSDYEDINALLKFIDKKPKFLLNIPESLIEDNTFKKALIESFTSSERGKDYDKDSLLEDFSRETIKVIVGTFRYKDTLDLSETYEKIKQETLELN